MPFSTLYALFHIVHLFFIFLFDNFSNFKAFVYISFIFPMNDAFFSFIQQFIQFWKENYSFNKLFIQKIWNYSFKEIIHSFEKWIIAKGYRVTWLVAISSCYVSFQTYTIYVLWWEWNDNQRLIFTSLLDLHWILCLDWPQFASKKCICSSFVASKVGFDTRSCAQ